VFCGKEGIGAEHTAGRAHGSARKKSLVLYKGRSSPKGVERGIDPQLTFGERVDHGLSELKGGEMIRSGGSNIHKGGVATLFDTREKRGGFNEAWWYTTLQSEGDLRSSKYER
jgi:hypothetical protein